MARKRPLRPNDSSQARNIQNQPTIANTISQLDLAKETVAPFIENIRRRILPLYPLVTKAEVVEGVEYLANYEEGAPIPQNSPAILAALSVGALSGYLPQKTVILPQPISHEQRLGYTYFLAAHRLSELHWGLPASCSSVAFTLFAALFASSTDCKDKKPTIYLREALDDLFDIFRRRESAYLDLDSLRLQQFRPPLATDPNDIRVLLCFWTWVRLQMEEVEYQWYGRVVSTYLNPTPGVPPQYITSTEYPQTFASYFLQYAETMPYPHLGEAARLGLLEEVRESDLQRLADLFALSSLQVESQPVWASLSPAETRQCMVAEIARVEHQIVKKVENRQLIKSIVLDKLWDQFSSLQRAFYIQNTCICLACPSVPEEVRWQQHTRKGISVIIRLIDGMMTQDRATGNLYMLPNIELDCDVLVTTLSNPQYKQHHLQVSMSIQKVIYYLERLSCQEHHTATSLLAEIKSQHGNLLAQNQWAKIMEKVRAKSPGYSQMRPPYGP